MRSYRARRSPNGLSTKCPLQSPHLKALGHLHRSTKLRNISLMSLSSKVQETLQIFANTLLTQLCCFFFLFNWNWKWPMVIIKVWLLCQKARRPLEKTVFVQWGKNNLQKKDTFPQQVSNQWLVKYDRCKIRYL